MNGIPSLKNFVIPVLPACKAGLIRDLLRSAMIFLFAVASIISNSTFSFSQSSEETIKIGFLIRDKNDLAIQQAAKLAIEHANAKGGFKGLPFEVVIKSCDGPWGIGSKQTVDLIFEDQVPILVTALDGRNAHLAEQVTAKSHVVMLSTLSSDPTLSRAYVPWYFRMVPDDKQQSAALVKEIYMKNERQKVGIIALDEYDGQKSAEALVARMKEEGLPTPVVINGLEHQGLSDKINKTWDAVVLSGNSTHTSDIIEQIKSTNIEMKIYAFINVYNFMDNVQAEFIENIRFVNSFKFDDPKWLSFKKLYQSKYGKYPSPSLAYVYDGIMLSTEAILKLGPDTEIIRAGFKDLRYHGITGKVEFDTFGNRELVLKLVE